METQVFLVRVTKIAPSVPGPSRAAPDLAVVSKTQNIRFGSEIPRIWLFQSNPQLYDLRAALRSLDGLSFYYGATLADPHRLLLGSGSQNRFLRIESAQMPLRPEVEDLIGAAIEHAQRPLPEKGRGRLIIRSISKKQRPRRKDGD
jgi:hypothetical protein